MTDEKTAVASMEKSRIEVMECEAEIKSIKDALKSLAMGGAGSSSLNHLEVSVHKVKAAMDGIDGDDDALPTTFKVHLSSPIEERTITKLYDPLDSTAEGSAAKFESIETSNALLTVEAYANEDGSGKLGVSAPHDLLPLCKGGEKRISTLEMAIVSENGKADADEFKDAAETTSEADLKKSESESFEDAVDEAKESPAKDELAQDTSKTAQLQVPLYTLTVQLIYTPSPDDKRDALYDKLNEVSKRKAAAIESLRKNAGVVNRAKAAEASGSPSKGNGIVSKSGPAVKSGFLNKSKVGGEEKPPPFWKRWYEKTIGPRSMLWVVGPIAKNYVIFIGLSLFIHYKGDLLALPPPV